jgi:hypothetical protein
VPALFGVIDSEEFDETLFQLMYTAHGGSGLGMSYSDIMELPLAKLRFFAERQHDVRREEAAAIKAAHSKGSKR